jgi:hypothetical protein
LILKRYTIRSSTAFGTSTVKQGYLLSSNDNLNWTLLSSPTLSSTNSYYNVYTTTSNTEGYYYYRFIANSCYTNNNGYAAVNTLILCGHIL